MNRLLTILCAVLITSLAACNQQTNPTSERSPAASARPAFVLTDELRAQLAVADAADGKTDHVVEKCVMCKLHMPGNPRFAVAVGDYSVQLCSESCRAAFEKDPAKALLALGKP